MAAERGRGCGEVAVECRRETGSDTTPGPEIEDPGREMEAEGHKVIWAIMELATLSYGGGNETRLG